MKKLLFAFIVLGAFTSATEIEICPIVVNEDALQVSDKAYTFYLKRDIRNAVQLYEEAKEKLQYVALAFECNNNYLIRRLDQKIQDLKT